MRPEPSEFPSGYLMPAEWAPHQATWISWPHNRDTWPGKFEPVEPVMAEFVGVLSRDELVRINVQDSADERRVRELLEGRARAANIVFHQFPTNDAWCRDHGAIFLTSELAGTARLAALDFEFNSWGNKYPPFDLDNAIPRLMAGALAVPCYHVDAVLEGGSIDVNGAGTLLTTENCLLNPNRNPSMTREQIETMLRRYFGVKQILWLGDGIAGDDTDGHVDDLTRFVAEDMVVTVVEADRNEANYAALAENRERLDGFRLEDGRPLRVIELAMPRPVEFAGDRLPASYANFYIGNKVVVMPAFDDPADEPNRRVLAECFPGREIVPINCTDLVLGLGAFHCLTQQVPGV